MKTGRKAKKDEKKADKEVPVPTKVKQEIKVTVGRFGSEPVSITVTEPATISSVLSKAGINTSSTEKVWLNGEIATSNSNVKQGDIVSIVSSKQAGK